VRVGLETHRYVVKKGMCRLVVAAAQYCLIRSRIKENARRIDWAEVQRCVALHGRLSEQSATGRSSLAATSDVSNYKPGEPLVVRCALTNLLRHRLQIVVVIAAWFGAAPLLDRFGDLANLGSNR